MPRIHADCAHEPQDSRHDQECLHSVIGHPHAAEDFLTPPPPGGLSHGHIERSVQNHTHHTRRRAGTASNAPAIEGESWLTDRLELPAPATPLAPMPSELVAALSELLAAAIVADLREYPNLAECGEKREATVVSPPGLNRNGSPPTTPASRAVTGSPTARESTPGAGNRQRRAPQ